jgi:hypothetical protein
LTERQSRCASGEGTELEWVKYVDDDHEEVIRLTRWLMTLPQAVMEECIGRIQALNERAAQGLVPRTDDDLCPIARDPDLWELRWNFGDNIPVRQYHGEPAELPDSLVRLHMHMKDTSSDDAQVINEAQNIQISYAILRYMAGRQGRWGKGS